MNPIAIFLAAFIPLLVGALWYSPLIAGNALQKINNIPEGEKRKAHSPWVFILTYILGLFLAMSMMSLTIHQIHFYSLIADDKTAEVAGSPMNQYALDYMRRFGSNFRTFKHGAFHGTMAAITIALPVLGIIAMFERKSFKYVAIHVGYWIVTLALMGGVVCAWAIA